MCFEPGRSRRVVGCAVGIVVNPAVEFQYQPELRAVEIHDEAIDSVLPSELEIKNPAVP